MMKKNVLIAGAMLLMITAFSVNKVQAQTCVMPPSCEDLGYTMTEADCQGKEMVLKCPTDMSKMACIDSGASQVVSVGAILYGDGTVASGVISGKQPIGVVFDINKRLAVALTDVKKNGSAGSETMYWSSNYCDTPNLENCTNSTEVVSMCGIDGRSNTNAILASTCNGTVYAAQAVNTYQISGCSKDFCKQGKWFLPSMRDLNTIYRFKSEINSTLTLLSSLGASKLTDNYYWSSTEGAGDLAWEFAMIGGSRSYTGKNGSNYVRPVIAF